MFPNDSKAQEYIKQAEKKLKPSLSNLFKPKEEQLEDAAELYIKAANSYKIIRDYDEAVKAYVLASECSLNSHNQYDAATALVDAAKTIHNEKLELSINYYGQAIEIFLDEGKFNIVAKYQMIVAEQYEKLDDSNHNFTSKAISAYELAAEYYASENSNANKNRCLRKIADMSAQQGNYEYAVQKYEEIIRNSLDNNLLKWGVKELFVLATLCHLANEDTVSAKLALDKYCDWDPSFTSTMENQFLNTICRSIDNYDVDMFVDALVKYDSMGKMDNLKTNLLLKIKRQMASMNVEEEGLA